MARAQLLPPSLDTRVGYIERRSLRDMGETESPHTPFTALRHSTAMHASALIDSDIPLRALLLAPCLRA